MRARQVAIEQRQRPGTHVVRAAVKPDHHRTFRLPGVSRGPHIEVEAVLAFRFRRKIAQRSSWAGYLHTPRSKRRRGPYAGPRLHRLWRPPTQLCYGRLCERNTLEDANFAVGTRSTGDEATFNLNNTIQRHALSRLGKTHCSLQRSMGDPFSAARLHREPVFCSCYYNDLAMGRYLRYGM